MAIPKRHAAMPGTYFVTSKTWEGRSTFQLPAACEIFIQSLMEYRGRGAYLLHAFVLMPDHFHILLTPGAETSLEHAVKLIKRGSSRKISEALASRFPVWQRGFSDHRIRDADDYRIHLAYISQNPAKRGLVMNSEDYAWSSASEKYALDDVPQGLKPLR